jgi:hypothetical protein
MAALRQVAAALRGVLIRAGLLAAVSFIVAACSGGGGTTNAVPAGNGTAPSSTPVTIVAGGGPGPSPSPSPVVTPAPVPSATAVPTPFPTGTSVPTALAPNASLTFSGGSPGYSIRVDFGSAVPAGETLYWHGTQPIGYFMATTFVDGVLFSVGPSPVPVSAITGVTQTLPAPPPAGTNYQAGVMDVPNFNAAPLPVAVAPSTAFHTGPGNAGTLTTLMPGTVYLIDISTY